MKKVIVAIVGLLLVTACSTQGSYMSVAHTTTTCGLQSCEIQSIHNHVFFD